MTTYANVNGHAVIVPEGAIAWKYTDATEDARWVYDASDRREIEREDPSLIEPVRDILDMRIEINANEGDRRVQLRPEETADGWSWQVIGEDPNFDAPHWHTVQEGLAVARQLWGTADWELEILDA